MCLLSYYAPGVPVDEDELRRGAEVNDEGHGFALTLPADDVRGILTAKGMDFGSVLRLFAGMRSEYPQSHAAFHSRLATTGRVCTQQAHPVMCCPNGSEWNAALFLNGTLDFPFEAIGKLSDTEHLAHGLESMDLDDPVHADALEIQAKRCNAKILILAADDLMAENAYIFNRDQWVVTPQGVLHSNADFRGKGTGWDESTCDDGTLLRWRMLQPGQCSFCFRYGCRNPAHPGEDYPPHPPAWRNETERRAKVRGR